MIAAACLRAACLGLLLAMTCAPALGAGLEYRVRIEAPKALEKILQEGLNLVRWQNDPEMSAEQLERLIGEAVREAREAAATEGYFSAQVEASIDEATEPRTVLLRVEPGERTQVAEVEIRFSGPAAQDADARARLAQVRSEWPLRVGMAFRQADWDAAKRQAVRELAGWRYAAAQVAASRALIDPDARRAVLSLEIASGPPFRFGALRVSGTRRYPEALVANLSPVRPGDTYDRDKLLLYQRLLLETGYFASVQAEIDAQPQLADAAPLRVAVIEAASQQVEAGVGYSTDAGPRVELRYGNQDVLESAWRFRSGLRLDEKIQTLQLDLDLPPREEGRWNSFFGRARRTDIQNETAQELALGFSHNFGLQLTPSALIVSAHAEEQRVGGDITDSRHALYFGFRRTFRRTDDFVSPRSGYFGSVELGGAPPALASQEFMRAVGSIAFFIPLGRSGDLLLRGEAGTVIAETRLGIPTTFLFRTGGDQTVRGYAFESIGVRQGDAIVGGRRLVVGSAEYTYWIGENWGAALFVDAGDVWDKGVQVNPSVGYGAGVRFRTPIGPIRADLAYGEETGQYRLHFSIGYRF